MKIYEDVDEFPEINFAVVTDGTFDGVHLGHQKIISRLKETARRKQGETVLLTLWPHPRIILNPTDHNLQLLTSFEEKAELLEEAGIDHLVKITFTKAFSQISREEFVNRYLVQKIKAKKLIIGYDHRFGRNREGNFDYLVENSERFGFDVEEISKQDLDDIAISSTLIRKSLTEGNVMTASKYLGRFYSLRGEVVKGNQVGRALGFPTANIQVDEPLKLIPGDGAYAVKVKHDGLTFSGMLNIGYRPTVDGKTKSIEVHIFNFDQDLYGRSIEVSFIRQIRKEKKFTDTEELRSQLHNDRELALDLLKNIE